MRIQGHINHVGQVWSQLEEERQLFLDLRRTDIRLLAFAAIVATIVERRVGVPRRVVIALKLFDLIEFLTQPIEETVEEFLSIFLSTVTKVFTEIWNGKRNYS